MIYHALRLHPGQDFKSELQQFIAAHNIQAACLITCVGSLSRAAIRYAGCDTATILERKMEILSLVGTLGTGGVHLHIAVADSRGQVAGGHVMEGCIVYTTAEIVIGELPGVVFDREFDPETGYRELLIKKRDTDDTDRTDLH